MNRIDFTKFSDQWRILVQVKSGKIASDQSCHMIYELVKNYSEEVVLKTIQSLYTIPYQINAGDIVNLLMRGGYTLQQYQCKAKYIYRSVSEYFRRDSDLVFSDRITALTFYTVIGSHEAYCLTNREDDTKLAKAFVDFYSNYDCSSFPDDIDDLMLVQSNHHCFGQLPKVVFIGDSSICSDICNRIYGVGNYQIVPKRELSLCLFLRKKNILHRKNISSLLIRLYLNLEDYKHEIL